MAQSVRVEFVTLGIGGNGSPENVLRATGNPPTGQTLAVSNAATASADRPTVSGGEFGQSVRLTAIGNPVYVTWGANPAATLANSVRLAVESPEVVYVAIGHKLSFIAENP